MDPNKDDIRATALMLWREGRGELERFGMVAVAAIAWVLRHRVDKRLTSYYAEVYRKRQFTSMSDPSDSQYYLEPVDGDELYEQCETITRRVMDGTIADPTDGCTLYWNPDGVKSSRLMTLPWGKTVTFPSTWDPTKVQPVIQIGHHIFARELP